MGIDKADVKTVIHNFQKISKIIIKKQVDLAEMEKSICGTLNPSDIQAENQFIHILPEKISTRCTINSVIFSNCLWRRDRKILL
jgi:hypothetical protein